VVIKRQNNDQASVDRGYGVVLVGDAPVARDLAQADGQAKQEAIFISRVA
jgi:hypothetical protein